jgi:hypothetical protein
MHSNQRKKITPAKRNYIAYSTEFGVGRATFNDFLLRIVGQSQALRARESELGYDYRRSGIHCQWRL